MRRLVTLFFMLFSFNIYGQELACEAWYQEANGKLEEIKMVIQSQTQNNQIFSVSYKDYTYKVDWDKSLTSLYTSIESVGKKILFTTARVPTESHNDSFTDINIPGGPRLSIHCVNR